MWKHWKRQLPNILTALAAAWSCHLENFTNVSKHKHTVYDLCLFCILINRKNGILSHPSILFIWLPYWSNGDSQGSRCLSSQCLDDKDDTPVLTGRSDLSTVPWDGTYRRVILDGSFAPYWNKGCAVLLQQSLETRKEVPINLAQNYSKPQATLYRVNKQLG